MLKKANKTEKESKKISTSVAKKFEPQWIDADTLEYNDPNGTKRITKQIP